MNSSNHGWQPTSSLQLHTATPHTASSHLIQSDRHSCCRRVAILCQVADHPAVVDAKPLGHGVEDALVGLVQHKVINLILGDSCVIQALLDHCRD